MAKTRYLLRFYTRLTERQQDVVQLASYGLTNKQIAKRMCIESSVVAEHLTNIYDILYNFDGYDRTVRPNRYVIVSLFTIFFYEHPDLRDWYP